MHVTLFRDLREEHWPSIEVYADRLGRGLRALSPQDTFEEAVVPAWHLPDWSVPMPYGRRASLRTLGLYLSRYVRYPLHARQQRADVYHVLANSYGNLVFALDPARTLLTSPAVTPRSWRRWNP